MLILHGQARPWGVVVVRNGFVGGPQELMWCPEEDLDRKFDSAILYESRSAPPLRRHHGKRT